MNALLGILLAQRSRLDNLSDAFRSRPNSTDRDDVLLGALIVVALIAGIWGLSRLLATRERHQVYSNPRRLFLSLCKAHRLRWSEQWLLWRVARFQRLGDPARLFLEPERFEEANLSRPLRAQIARLRGLRNRLFAKPSAKGSEPPQTAAGPRPVTMKAAMPLFSTSASPTLDIPPWTSEG